MLLSAPSTIAELVEAVAELLGSPVTVEDPNFRLVAYSRQAGPVDRARRDTIFNKAVPLEIAQWLQRSGAMNRIYRSVLPVRVPACPRLGLAPRTAIAIRAGDRILGQIWIMEQRRPPAPDAVRILSQAATTAAVLLLRQEAEQTAHTRLVGEFLVDLLDGQVVSETAARRRADALQIELLKPFAVLVVDIDEFETHIDGQDEAWVQALKAELLAAIRAIARRFGERSLALLRSDSAVVLFGDRPGAPETPALPDRVRALADALHAHLPQRFPRLSFSIGASRVLHELDHLPQAYRQATEAARICGGFLGRRLPVNYDDLGIYRLLRTVRDHNLAEGYRDPHLERFESHDRVRGTELVATLEAYLDAFGDVTAVATKLAVHPNTIRYRLRQMRQVGDLDLADASKRLIIHVELKLRHLTPLGPSPVLPR
ncbi:MAG TPA: helix-turn-helix domain-containing protein [bacterium]|nr:helix-turn-helix domain-containing protein [bacterium]